MRCKVPVSAAWEMGMWTPCSSIWSVEGSSMSSPENEKLNADILNCVRDVGEEFMSLILGKHPKWFSAIMKRESLF